MNLYFNLLTLLIQQTTCPLRKEVFFDPLRLIFSIVLQIKILFKEACALKCTWDDVLNDKFIEKWKKFFRELENLTPIKVGRHLFTNHYGVIDFELH